MNDVQTFRIVLVLPKLEAEALARLAERQLRPMREQAHYLLRASLIAERVLPDPDPIPQLATEVRAAKHLSLRDAIRLLAGAWQGRGQG